MGGVFYFLLIRPQQKRQRAQRDLLGSLDVGDDVVTIGGAYGVIREMDDETVTIEVSPGVQIKFLRGAIARKLVEDEEYDATEDEEAGDQS
jgi:preprotein translocase subunit YajC